MAHVGRKILSREDLEALSAEIGTVESKTAGEIRIVVRHRRHFTERRLSLHDLALREFVRLGMHKTESRTGVLILLLVSEKKFHIIADEGIHRLVPEGTWDEVASAMSAHFREGRFRQGIAETVQKVGNLLAAHLPPVPGDTNELSNDVIEE